jgi:hypothetical protein
VVVTLVVGCWQMLLAASHSTILQDRYSVHIAGRGLPHVCGKNQYKCGDADVCGLQFGGSPVKAGEEEYQLFRDSE